MKKILIAALVLSSASAMAFKTKTKYGTAGCGLGSMLLGDEPGFAQVFAATTNGSTGTQTFGITTGTSNCGKGAVDGLTAFIEANRASLANDIARGNGETLNSLSAMYGCNDQGMGQVLQANFEEIFPSPQTPASQIEQSISGYMNSCQIKG